MQYSTPQRWGMHRHAMKSAELRQIGITQFNVTQFCNGTGGSQG
jgi:hypothetical protein